jgi:DNA-directed RNA polymerase specialized sigma24 family protein
MQRAVVLLRDVEGLSGEEACDVLDRRAGDQRILLLRGRAGLRHTLAARMRKV